MLGEDTLYLGAFVEDHAGDTSRHSAFVTNPAEDAGKIFESRAFGAAVEPALGVAVGSAFAGHDHSPSMFAELVNARVPLELHLVHSTRRKNLCEPGKIMREPRMFALPGRPVEP